MPTTEPPSHSPWRRLPLFAAIALVAGSLALIGNAGAQESTDCGTAPEGYNVIVSDESTINGTDEDDFICAGDSDNLIRGLDGHDIIFGNGGRDLILGGKGMDVIDGGDLRDRIKGGKGADTINGGLADDKIWGNGGGDTINGQNGDDIIRAGGGDDTVEGGGGDDTIDGGDGTNLIDGGTGTNECTSVTEVDRCTVSDTDAPDENQFGSIGEAVAAALWGENTTVTIDGDFLSITSDGIPNHEYPTQWAAPDNPFDISPENARIIGDVVGAQNYSLDVPMNPVYSEQTTDTNFGLIGLIISGGALYNPFEAGGGIALDQNFSIEGAMFIDSCNGHPNGNRAYHYHGVPWCISDALDTFDAHSAMVGVLLDGFPVYGPNEAGGEAPTDLDECNGHFGPTPEFPDGIYHYHLTEAAPYSISCYHGEVPTF